MAMLEVIIGMIFTFMVLSLLGTTLNELLSAWRGWRGFYMEEGLKRLLEFKDDPSVFNKFKNNPFFRQLMQHPAPFRVSQAPAYLTSSDFTSILFSVLKKKGVPVEKVEDLLGDLPEKSQLREVLEQIKDEGHQNVQAYEARLQGWFNGVMGQASGWYKRHLQMVTILVGFVVAGVLNADSFQIYSNLTKNSVARENLASMAEAFATNNNTLPSTATTPGDSLTFDQIRTEFNKARNSGDFAEVSNILGLGWRIGDASVGIKKWLIRLLGWLITALAISLGAPFWFDVLKRIITIRSSGETVSSERNTPSVVINTGNVEADVKKL
ncbi:MAG: hypothetical protein H6577_20405 [Lewinellaceae bacterium]|nr:hypothetical protein [Saprospiraceae bacterium]MCB9340493.1 hypothetical protein [Lewinellaceae bacterium]